MDSKRLTVGRIAGAHGVRGALRVDSSTGVDSWIDVDRLFIDGKEYVIENVRPIPTGALVELEGLTDRDKAHALRGKLIEVLREELPALDDDELYVADLIGCEVVDAAGARIGRVERTENNGAQELLVVVGEKGGVVVPFVEPIVMGVDLKARRIICDLPEGLPEP